jgi:O-antigen chain-terminating methyltransferase
MEARNEVFERRTLGGWIKRLVLGASVRNRAEAEAFRESLRSLKDEVADLRGSAGRARALETSFESLKDEIASLREVAGGAEALEETLRSLRDEVESLRKTIDSVGETELAAEQRRNVELSALGNRFNALAKALDDAKSSLRAKMENIESASRFERLTRQKAIASLEYRWALATIGKTSELPAPAAIAAAPSSTSVQALLERFYFTLQERYRGTREDIKQRLLVYRNDIRSASARAGILGPIIDIGCGRGELLEILQEDGFEAIGVDSNDTQLEVARLHGLAVIQAEAVVYIRALKDQSVLAIAGIHIVEHIPFVELMALMREVARVLKKGGVAIFETPNPRNLIVGATTFHFDPTHIRPLPAEVLELVLETVGFNEIERRVLHPSETLEYMVANHGLDRHVATLLFGPQDYAVIGVRT